MDNKYTTEYWSNRGVGLNILRAQHGRYVTGSIGFVKKTTDADYEQFINLHYEDAVYATIATGLAACTASLGDFIGVDKGTYAENLTMSLADVTLRGLGTTPYSTVVNGAGTICITVTGVDVAIENLNFLQTGAAVVCIYGTGLVGAPRIEDCFFDAIELTSLACIRIAGATSRGLIVRGCTFEGGSTSADAVNYSGAASHVVNNTSDGFNGTVGTCFEGDQHSNVSN